MIHDEAAMQRLLVSDARTLAATRLLLLTGDAGPEGYPAGQRIELAPLPWRRGVYNPFVRVAADLFRDDPKGRTFKFRGGLRIAKGRDRKVRWAGGLLVNMRIAPHVLGELLADHGIQAEGFWEFDYQYTPPRAWLVTDAVPE